MAEIKERIQYANMSHEAHQQQTKEFEQRVEEIKTNLKVAMESEMTGGDFADVDFGFGDAANKKGYALPQFSYELCRRPCLTCRGHRRGKMKGPGAQMERLRRR